MKYSKSVCLFLILFFLFETFLFCNSTDTIKSHNLISDTIQITLDEELVTSSLNLCKGIRRDTAI